MAQTQPQQHDHHDEEGLLDTSNCDNNEYPAAYCGIFNLINKCVRRCAATSFGIVVIDKVSHFLEIVEKTTKWSLPVQQSANGENAEEIRLERPLSWIPFLGLIILLRIVQLILSFASIFIGNDPIQAKDMIAFIQMRRRKLRLLRLCACRSIHDREILSTKKSMLRNLISKFICRPRIDSTDDAAEAIIVEQQQRNDKEQMRPTLKRSRHTAEESGDESLTVSEMLDKFAADESANDSDFIPYLGKPTDTPDTSVTSMSTTAHSTSDESGNSSFRIQNQSFGITNPTISVRNYIAENGSESGGSQQESDLMKQLMNIKQEEVEKEEEDAFCGNDANKATGTENSTALLNGDLGVDDCEISDRSYKEMPINAPPVTTVTSNKAATAATAPSRPLLIRQNSITTSNFHRI